MVVWRSTLGLKDLVCRCCSNHLKRSTSRGNLRSKKIWKNERNRRKGNLLNDGLSKKYQSLGNIEQARTLGKLVPCRALCLFLMRRLQRKLWLFIRGVTKKHRLSDMNAGKPVCGNDFISPCDLTMNEGSGTLRTDLADWKKMLLTKPIRILEGCFQSLVDLNDRHTYYPSPIDI